MRFKTLSAGLFGLAIVSCLSTGCLDPDTSSSGCPFTYDGECDEPEGTGLCADGTDAYDCSGSSRGGGGGGGGNSCVSSGSSCQSNSQCCSFVNGTGGCLSQSDGSGVCADGCSSSAGCNSGCCVLTERGIGVCGPRTSTATCI